ncbi:hypothetical protein ZIOFF_054129 [Zingiber officinale]|uniref:beta-aspartyl-peptidase n=1 Tax=Zingiber officinale TaxID=94328 RepID=A0A8J5KP48_ZINOF|nr:hypothetical protein ZIOFF_054129 [Zingiber officinale]
MSPRFISLSFFFLSISTVLEISGVHGSGIYPVVVSTWPFREAVRAAWRSVNDYGSSAVTAVVEGCSACEELRCDGTDASGVPHSYAIVISCTFAISILIPNTNPLCRFIAGHEFAPTLSYSFPTPCRLHCHLGPYSFHKVGPGGSPDENGETTLDALVMDGTTMEVGAVAAMRFVKDGIKAAKLVMDFTEHTLLVGEKASIFAMSMGLSGPTNLSSAESIEKWVKWKKENCQPNFRKNVIPAKGCGPYHLHDNVLSVRESSCKVSELNNGESNWFGDGNDLHSFERQFKFVNRHNHDTISMAVIDKMGHIAVGTSTNGATFKVPGRQASGVGDGPIAGSSAYADSEVGACGATGDGDIMMRFLPCYQVVESMRQGMEPKHAAVDAISRIARKFPNFVGAVVAIDKKGVHAGACHGWTFQYSVKNSSMEDVEVFTVVP